jgi:hypothetical protein
LLKSVVEIVNLLLLQDDKWSYSFDPKLQELITQLESGLQSVLLKGDQSAHHHAEFSGNFAGGFSVVCVFMCVYACRQTHTHTHVELPCSDLTIFYDIPGFQGGLK